MSDNIFREFAAIHENLGRGERARFQVEIAGDIAVFSCSCLAHTGEPDINFGPRLFLRGVVDNVGNFEPYRTCWCRIA